MERFYNLNKKDKFIGSEALKQKILKGIEIKIVYLEVITEDADPLGNEPIYYNDKIVGVVTSGGYGFRVNKSLAFAYVEAKLLQNVNEFQIKIQGENRRATVLEQMAYDPNNSKLRS